VLTKGFFVINRCTGALEISGHYIGCEPIYMQTMGAVVALNALGRRRKKQSKTNKRHSVPSCTQQNVNCVNALVANML